MSCCQHRGCLLRGISLACIIHTHMPLTQEHWLRCLSCTCLQVFEMSRKDGLLREVVEEMILSWRRIIEFPCNGSSRQYRAAAVLSGINRLPIPLVCHPREGACDHECSVWPILGQNSVT